MVSCERNAGFVSRLWKDSWLWRHAAGLLMLFGSKTCGALCRSEIEKEKCYSEKHILFRANTALWLEHLCAYFMHSGEEGQLRTMGCECYSEMSLRSA